MDGSKHRECNVFVFCVSLSPSSLLRLFFHMAAHCCVRLTLSVLFISPLSFTFFHYYLYFSCTICLLIVYFPFPDMLSVYFFPPSSAPLSLSLSSTQPNPHPLVAESRKLVDCPQLLDVEDMVRMREPDWKCVYTYLQEFYKGLVQKGLVKTKNS